jgi:hypothetical protein
MIPIPSGVRVWIATGHTDMRRGMNGLTCRCSRRSSAIRMPAISLCSVGAGATS